MNLGTVYFNARDWRRAEQFYRKAVEVDPEYALAHFNLGNLYDERGDRSAALDHYLAAHRGFIPAMPTRITISLCLYQAMGQPLKAVRHWKAYLTMDHGKRLGRDRPPRTGQDQRIRHSARPDSNAASTVLFVNHARASFATFSKRPAPQTNDRLRESLRVLSRNAFAPKPAVQFQHSGSLPPTIASVGATHPSERITGKIGPASARHYRMDQTRPAAAATNAAPAPVLASK